MAARIEVPGVFVFEGNDVQFHFAGNTGVIAFTELMQDAAARKILLAVLGVGFAKLEQELKGSPAPVIEPSEPKPEKTQQSYIDDIMQQYKEAEENLRSFQETAKANLDAIQRQYGTTTTTTSDKP